MSAEYLVMTDILWNEKLYVRGAETWVERQPDGPGPHRCMPISWHGWAKEADVHRYCERVERNLF